MFDNLHSTAQAILSFIPIALAMLYVFVGAVFLGETFSGSLDDVVDDARKKKLTTKRCIFHIVKAAFLCLCLYGWPALFIVAGFQYGVRWIKGWYSNGKKS